MCGIAGFIGYSKNRAYSFRLITALFEESELRGVDAAGYWGAEPGDGAIVYHKEPIKSSEFIKKNVWRDLINHDLNLLLVHARGASSGVGPPSDNKNNHPFASTCRSIGLVHNGRIPDFEYQALLKKYEVNSKCDSEILLRIFEAGKTYTETDCLAEEYDQLGSQLMGLRDIWSYVDKGHMAVAIGERVDDDARRLFLFRNRHRSLWLADTRKELGQVYFCSTPDIWNNAFRTSGLSKIFKNRIKMIELPTEELWLLQINQNQPEVGNVKKYDICSNGRLVWKHEGDKIKIIQNPPATEIITKLGEKEEIIQSKKETTRLNYYEDYVEDEVKPWELKLNMSDFNTACNSIESSLIELHRVVESKMMDGSMSEQEFKDLLQSLENVGLDLEGSIKLLN